MKKVFLLFLSSLLILLTGCLGGKAEEGSKQLKSANTGGVSSEATAVFKKNVKQVSQVTIKDESTIILPSNSSYKIGDIIIFSSNVNNNKIAKKIIAIENNVATVSEPTLEEIFDKLEINDSVELITENLDKNSLPAGVVVQNNKPNSASGAISKDDTGLKYYISDVELIDYSKFSPQVANALRAANTTVKVSGSVFLKKPKVDFSYSLFSKSVKLTLTTGDETELSLYGNTNYEKILIDREIFLGNYVIPINAAGIPLGNLTFALTMNAGVNGKINFNVRAYQQLNVTVGIEGKYGSNAGINFIYPNKQELEQSLKYGYDAQSNGNLDAWCSLKPRASLIVFQYEMAAVRGDLGVEGHVSGSASSSGSDSQPVTAYANLSTNAKVYAKVDADFKPLPTEPTQTKNILNWSKEFNGSWTYIK